MNEILETPRLRLRQWRDEDRPAFAELNADLRVMEHFPQTLERTESDAMAERIRQRIEQNGWGLWAVEATGVSPFIGYVGLTVPRFEAHFTPCIELGWRLAHAYWGRGYATEAACAAVDHAFDRLNLKELVAFTVPANIRSRAVMKRLGMTNDSAEDFDRPGFADPYRRHVLYRLAATDWLAR
jgi:RimJ/RimL family protein N-acetyltransferase